MQTYELLVKNRTVIPNSEDMTLVRTSAGIDQAHILFDNPEWLDFALTATFSQGGRDPVTAPLVVSAVSDSPDWVAEATVEIPYETMEQTGTVRVTINGTDSEGRHIVTTLSEPLTVEREGDLPTGDPPEGYDTPDPWEQAYADAMTAANSAQSAASEIEGIIGGVTLSDLVDAAEVAASFIELMDGVMRYKGEADEYSELPESPTEGDMYRVVGSETDHPSGFYLYDGTSWVVIEGGGGGGGGGNMTLAGSVTSWASLPASPSLGDVYHFTGDYTHAKGFYLYDGTSWAHVGEGVSESDVQAPLLSDDGTLMLATSDRHFVTNEYGVLEVNIDGETITAGYDPVSDEFSDSYQVRVNPRMLVDGETIVYDLATDRIMVDLSAIVDGTTIGVDQNGKLCVL